ncbi:fibrinogen-like protein 1 [Drosophila nasuta]|uniref:fibrinogen-like protein 1 n=1 Tax=Drosophila nasuta TaxID=42062 RepID=UPI00295ED14F|nr:fibrinogen-like protein 1 [Drosophila nasuta]
MNCGTKFLLFSTTFLISCISLSGADWFCDSCEEKIRPIQQLLSRTLINNKQIELELHQCTTNIHISEIIEQKFMKLNEKLDKQPNTISQEFSKLSQLSQISIDKLSAIEKQQQSSHHRELNTITELQAKLYEKNKELKAKENECADLRNQLNAMKNVIKEKETQLIENEKRAKIVLEQKIKEKYDELKIIKSQKESEEEHNAKLEAKTQNLENQLSLYSTCCKTESCQTFGNSTNANIIQIPDSEPMKLSCNDVIAEPGWLVFQRRIDGHEDFNRNWTDYQMGFGNVEEEFFLGLEKLQQITKSEPHELYIQLEDYANEKSCAYYDRFEIGDADENYVLKSIGTYSGTAGNSLQENIEQQFSTYDHDNDSDEINCAKLLSGGWWYSNCGFSNLNGKYAKDIFWDEWRGYEYSLKSVIMMIRPKNNHH